MTAKRKSAMKPKSPKRKSPAKSPKRKSPAKSPAKRKSPAKSPAKRKSPAKCPKRKSPAKSPKRKSPAKSPKRKSTMKPKSPAKCPAKRKNTNRGLFSPKGPLKVEVRGNGVSSREKAEKCNVDVAQNQKFTLLNNVYCFNIYLDEDDRKVETIVLNTFNTKDTEPINGKMYVISGSKLNDCNNQFRIDNVVFELVKETGKYSIKFVKYINY